MDGIDVVHFGPPALTVDDAGSVFVAGGYNGTASFGDIELSGTGTSEAFVAGLNTAFANQSADLPAAAVRVSNASPSGRSAHLYLPGVEPWSERGLS